MFASLRASFRSRVRLATVFASVAMGFAALGASCSAPPLQSVPDGNSGGGGGATACEAKATCLVTFSHPLGGESSVVLRGDFAPDGWDVGVPLTIDGGEWRTTLELQNGQRVRYKFFINGTDWVPDPRNPDKEGDGLGGENSVKVAQCGNAVLCDDPPGVGGSGQGGTSGEGAGPPDNPNAFDWRSAVLYFVFVDRFRNGDTSNDAPVSGVDAPANYQGGDFAGLLEKIEEGYFDKLGVNALWLTVPFDNTSQKGKGFDGRDYTAYHGYWVKDLDKIEEHFGDLALLKKVIAAAHQRKIKILFDYAMNHVHTESPLFTQHPDWFWPLDYNGKYCVCGGGCDWNDDYEQRRCWFTDYLPDWNFTNPEARAYSVDNAVKWVKETGIDGFRLDAVKHIETIWIEDLRKRISKEVEAETGERFYMVGETFESGNRDILRKYVSKSLLDGQFDFPLRGSIVETILRRQSNFFDFDNFLNSNDNYYDGVMSTFIGNHDIARVIQTALDQPWGAWDNGGDANWNNPPGLPNYKAPFERLAVAYTFLMTTKGVPLIYYGDEIGMPGAGDPDNRRFMQWDGYDDNQLFLRGVLETLGKIRREHPALWRGTRTKVSVTNDTYSYEMRDPESDDVIYVGLNRGDLDGAVGGMPTSGTDLLTGKATTGPSILLPPRTAVVVVPK